LERVTDEKLTHMLSIQKSPNDKTRLGYIASTSDIPFTSKTMFVKPTVPEPPTTVKTANFIRSCYFNEEHDKMDGQPVEGLSTTTTDKAGMGFCHESGSATPKGKNPLIIFFLFFL
jgi:hypothetical protein